MAGKLELSDWEFETTMTDNSGDTLLYSLCLCFSSKLLLYVKGTPPFSCGLNFAASILWGLCGRAQAPSGSLRAGGFHLGSCEARPGGGCQVISRLPLHPDGGVLSPFRCDAASWHITRRGHSQKPLLPLLLHTVHVFVRGSGRWLPADPGPQHYHFPLGPWKGESSHFISSCGHVYSQQSLNVREIMVFQTKTRQSNHACPPLVWGLRL